MWKAIQRSLKKQLITFILISVIVPVFFLGLVSYFYTVNLSKERAALSGSSSLQQLETSLNFMIEDVQGISVFLIGNRDVQDYLQGNNSSIRQSSNINGFLANLAYSKEYISNITLYPQSENPIISTSPREVKEHNFAERTENKWWTYKQYEETSQGINETITFTRPVRSLNGFEEIGFLSISINQKYVEELLRSIDLEWSGSILLMDDTHVLGSSNEVQFKNNEVQSLMDNLEENNSTIQSVTEVINNQKSTVFSTQLKGVDWGLIGIIPYKEYSSQNRYLLSLTVVTIIIASTFVVLLALFLIFRVLNPLLTLTHSLRNTEPGELIEQYPTTSNDEVGELIASYNALNQRITFLMERIQAGESIKRKVDLQALQNQINPHFLYNTLASIHWIALGSGSPEISEMVSSLSKYLRYSLNKGSEYCTVEQEIDHLYHYTQIQEVRFPDTFEVTLDIFETVKHYKILKLLLQPIIENSILHGKTPGMNALVKIKVSINEVGHRLYFTIEDDGVGMSAEKLITLNERFVDDQTRNSVIGDNYGLRNVNLRLTIHYGEQAALQIANNENGGLTIQFSIPTEGGS